MGKMAAFTTHSGMTGGTPFGVEFFEFAEYTQGLGVATCEFLRGVLFMGD